MSGHNMKIKNIKVRFVFKSDIIEKQKKQIIWKNGKFTSTIYGGATKFINVTGLKNSREIKQQKLLVEEIYQQKVISVKIDNIFYSKKDYKNIDMNSLYSYIKENKDYFCNYNIEMFAGMYLHPSNKLYPTILVFRTGSYQIMGGKSLKLIYKSEIFVKELIQMFEK